MVHTKKVPSTISLQMARLKAADIVKVRNRMNSIIMRLEWINWYYKTYYPKYTCSFTEKIVDNYVDMINELE